MKADFFSFSLVSTHSQQREARGRVVSAEFDLKAELYPKTSRTWLETFLLEEDLWRDLFYSLSYKHPITAHHWSLLPILNLQPHPESLFSGSIRIELKFFNLAPSWSLNLICSDNHIFSGCSQPAMKMCSCWAFRNSARSFETEEKKEVWWCQYSFHWKEKRWFICGQHNTDWVTHILVFLSFSSLTMGSIIHISQ